ncbi:MAG: siderophore ABC transporter substrate-binding protein [Aristaeellaceae bacterium]
MKKLLALALALLMICGVAACAETAPETIVLQTYDGDSQPIELELPYDPQRIVVLDMACLDILVSLGMEERIVGSVASTLEYLNAYASADGVANVGTVKTFDLEGIMECEPDLILMGGRGAEFYDSLVEIAPVVRIITDSSIGLVESVTVHSKEIASLFGLEAEIDAKVAGFADRIEVLCSFAEGKTMILGMCSGGGFSAIGDTGRCSIIGTEIGFENIGVAEDRETSTHGDEASFEFILDLNPDYIFVMDRDAAIGASEGVQTAREIMENELVMSTDAYKNGHLIILAHPAAWYTGEGGITALDIMLQDLESALLNR